MPTTHDATRSLDAADHLEAALDTADIDEKDFHIRQALQLLMTPDDV